MKKPRTPEEIDAQRAAARLVRRQKREAEMQTWRLEHQRYSEARAVACQAYGLRYLPVPHARTREDAERAHLYVGHDDLVSKLALQRLAPDSFEILTETVRG